MTSFCGDFWDKMTLYGKLTSFFLDQFFSKSYPISISNYLQNFVSLAFTVFKQLNFSFTCCTTLHGVNWAFGCLWERTLLSLGCSDVCGSVHGCLWAVRFRLGMYAWLWDRTWLSLGRTAYDGYVRAIRLGARWKLGPYPVVSGIYGCRWVRTQLSCGRTVFIGPLRLTLGPYMVVVGPYDLRWVRTRYTTGRTVVVGSVRKYISYLIIPN